MILRLLFSCVIGVGFLTSKSFAEEKVKPLTMQQMQSNMATAAKYVNSFETIQNLFGGYEGMGLIDSKDATQILNFLQKNEVDINAKMPKIIVVDNQYKIGDVVVHKQASGFFKTSAGVVIEVDPKKSVFENYQMAFVALKQQEPVSLFHFFIPKAMAESKEKKTVNMATVVGGIYLDMILDGLHYPYTAVGAGLNNGIAGFISIVVNPIRENDGEVECYGDKYVYTNGFKDNKSPFDEVISAKIHCENLRKEGSRVAGGKFCEYVYATGVYYKETVYKELDRYIVHSDEIKKHLGASIPNCTKTLAIKLQDKLKERREKLEKLRQEAKAELTKSSSSKTATPAATGTGKK